jgi:hypothetical protein
MWLYRHLIYGNADEPDPLVKFNFEDFISGSVTEVMFVSIDEYVSLDIVFGRFVLSFEVLRADTCLECRATK